MHFYHTNSIFFTSRLKNDYFQRCLPLFIVLCEIFNPTTHGVDENSDPYITGHHLVHSQYDIDNWDELIHVITHYKKHILQNSRNPNLNKHPIIRNYKNIITHKKYIKPEIAEIIYLSGKECIAILKTFWLRIFQRICKKKLNKKIKK